MKILIVNSSDIYGGAARAAYRLHKALLEVGIDSQMLVKDKKSNDVTVLGPVSFWFKAISKISAYFDSLPIKLYKKRSKKLFSPSWFKLNNTIRTINKLNPDIVHIHWICDGMMTIEDIARIKAPIIWSLHDMWAFTAGSHYCNCDGYKVSKGYCKALNSNIKNDISRRIFKRKHKTYAKKEDITIVGLSKWINECSKSSELLKDKKHFNIPNPIDTNIFKPFNKSYARNLWNLPKDKKLVLFGAMNATSDPRKGFKYLKDAMKKVSNDNIELIIFGSNKPENPPDLGYKIHYTGELMDDISLVTLYSSVDLMVAPSLQENLSNAIMESIACGTPVIGFDIGGNSDMIEHKKNGYLARPFESNDLAQGIEWILNANNYNELCINARDKVTKEFDNTIVAQKYLNLYSEILK
jgi:glycosyltransferase involved in cell wall biosynthesis